MNILNINLFKKCDLIKNTSRVDNVVDSIEKIMVEQSKVNQYRIEKNSIFISCISLNNHLLDQGWKIHVSASNKNYRQILFEVVPYLFSINVSFKVVSAIGRNVMLSKNFPREQTGKFITIYPQTKIQFLFFLQFLNKKLKDYTGIPVLTDKRISENNEVSYRYGAFKRMLKYDFEGDPIYSIKDSEGNKEPDDRTIGKYKPNWLSDDPVKINTNTVLDNQTTLMLQKYKFIAAIQFNNFGGVYEAIDNATNKHVIIKEARKYLGSTSFEGMIPSDIRAIRRKEYSTLLKISDLNVAPQPLDYFQTKNGDYLVEEYIDGNLLKNIRLQNPIYYPNSCEKDYHIYLQRIAKIFLNLNKNINWINVKGIVLNDLTPNNVLYDSQTLKVKIIDLESSTTNNNKVDRNSIFVTPGYTEMLNINKVAKNDRFSWVMCLIDSLICRAQLLNIAPSTITQSLDFLQCLYSGWARLCKYLKKYYVTRNENDFENIISELKRIAGND